MSQAGGELAESDHLLILEVAFVEPVCPVEHQMHGIGGEPRALADQLREVFLVDRQ